MRKSGQAHSWASPANPRLDRRTWRTRGRRTSTLIVTCITMKAIYTSGHRHISRRRPSPLAQGSSRPACPRARWRADGPCRHGRGVLRSARPVEQRGERLLALWDRVVQLAARERRSVSQLAKKEGKAAAKGALGEGRFRGRIGLRTFALRFEHAKRDRPAASAAQSYATERPCGFTSSAAAPDLAGIDLVAIVPCGYRRPC